MIDSFDASSDSNGYMTQHKYTTNEQQQWEQDCCKH